jgi:2-polyprenyl-3-methyl-5-hydroxy-6-metoxy-1,4-benzoquinol methylase
MNTRDYNLEATNNASRLYNYGFDLQIRKSLIKRFDKHVSINSSKSCLEIGSFDGSMTELLLDSHDFINVVEPSSEMAKLLKQKFPNSVKVTQSTIESVNLDHSFDYIYLIHTLEHLDNPVDALKKIGTLLAPNGVVLVAVPNARALSRQIAVEMGLIAYHAAVTEGEKLQGHCRTYTLDTLASDIHAAGFRIIYSGGVLLKTLANFQFDAALESGIVSQGYIEAIDGLSEIYPDLSSSIYAVIGN